MRYTRGCLRVNRELVLTMDVHGLSFLRDQHSAVPQSTEAWEPTKDVRACAFSLEPAEATVCVSSVCF